MQTTKTYDHENENIIEALGCDREKLDLLTQALDERISKQHKGFTSKSETYAEIISIADTPEEIILLVGYIEAKRKYQQKIMAIMGPDMEGILDSILKGLQDE